MSRMEHHDKENEHIFTGKDLCITQGLCRKEGCACRRQAGAARPIIRAGRF